MSNCRFRAITSGDLGGFVEHVHELHGLALEQGHHGVDACNQIVVGKQSDDADNQAGNGGYERRVDAVGEGCERGGRAGGIYTALVTTVAGLIVGVVALFAYNGNSRR